MPKLIKLHTLQNEEIYINTDQIVYAMPAGSEGSNTRIKLVCGEEFLVSETLDTTSDMISTKHKYIG